MHVRTCGLLVPVEHSTVVALYSVTLPSGIQHSGGLHSGIQQWWFAQRDHHNGIQLSGGLHFYSAQGDTAGGSHKYSTLLFCPAGHSVEVNLLGYSCWGAP